VLIKSQIVIKSVMGTCFIVIINNNGGGILSQKLGSSSKRLHPRYYMSILSDQNVDKPWITV
jgi:2-succinyl-5-enolpyruvyl-6-hydroxy-3-cyclohexene-1-carboxylate synthase